MLHAVRHTLKRLRLPREAEIGGALHHQQKPLEMDIFFCRGGLRDPLPESFATSRGAYFCAVLKLHGCAMGHTAMGDGNPGVTGG